MNALRSYAERFVPGGDYRTRAWARFVVMLAIASTPIWIIFTLLGVVLGLPAWCAFAFCSFAVVQLAVPFVMRKTGSVFLVMMGFGVVCYVGITLVAIVVGGFPTQVLLWTMALPIAVSAQRQYRSLVPIWAGLCLAQYGVWYALAASGHAPRGLVGTSDHAQLVVYAVVTVCWLALLLLISSFASSVTYEFADARDAYQHAVLQSQKLDALGKLAGAIENNFNNALMSMDYSAHLLARSLEGEASWDEEVAELRDTVRRSKALSRKLERLGRVESDNLELVIADEAIEGLQKTLQRVIGHEVTLNITHGAPGASVRCDANQLDQVLVNLVVNAADAMSRTGAITIATHTTPRGTLVIEVRDTGTGIQTDVLPHIFEPFFTTKDRDSGTGLGLWICRSIVQSCGGTLTATSALGVGTTMHVELPCADVDAAPRPPSPIHPSTRPSAASAPTRMPVTAGWRFLEWFVAGVTDQRERVWGVAIAVIALATVPCWLGFGVWYWTAFGPNVITGLLVASAAVSALVPLLLRLSRSPLTAAVVLGATAYVALTALALSRGGFQIQILVWTAIIPVAAALQREFRHFARVWAVAVVAQYALVYILAATGAGPAPMLILSPSQQLSENFLVLLVMLALYLMIFRATSRVTEVFASERDGYEAALTRSQDFETLGTFAGSIAHDLNNVLTTLEFSTSILHDRLPEHHPSQADVADLRAAGARIKDLSRQLTRFGRCDDDKAGRVTPALALGSLEPMLRPILGSHVQLCMELHSGAAAILCRNNAFDQLVVNLALNGRDAMPDGGTLTVTTEATDATVTISVTDTGVGIAEAMLSRVCDPFFSTDPDRMGLGLWVCKEIAAESRGELRVESELGYGTTVRVILPRAVRPPRTRGAKPTQLTA